MAIHPETLSTQRIYFIGLTPLGMLPLMRYIIPLFSDSQVTVITMHIRQSYRYDKFGLQQDIMVFNDTTALNNHTLVNKLKKYSGFLYRVITTFVRKKNCIVYTVDYQVAALLLWIKRTVNPTLKVVYHQFEAFESDSATGLNKKMQQYALENSNRLNLAIFPEVNRLKHFMRYVKGSNLDSLVIPNTNNLNLMAKGENGKYIGLQRPIVIAHIGRMASAHYTFSFFQWIRSNKQVNLRFLFIGKVEETAMIELFKLTAQDPRVEVIEEIPHEALLPYYATIDIGVILYKGIDLNHEYCAPNKLYEYWSQGIPVLAHRLEGLKSVWSKNFLGELVDMDNAMSIQTGVDKLIQVLPASSSLIRSWFEKEANLDVYLPQLREKVTAI